jgi:Flp pilus assembly protein TadD
MPNGLGAAPIGRATVTAIAACLVALAFAVHGRTLGHGFVVFDDPSYVTENDMVRHGITWSGLAWALTTSDRFYWHPLTWISHMLVFQVAGLNPWPHHALNVCIHAATAVLVFTAFHSMTVRAWPSAVVAALFAVHPLNVESVAWIAERKALLAGFFWFATVLAYARYARRPSLRSYAFVIACFACGLMSKPDVVTLPIVLLALDVWPLGRTAAIPRVHLLVEKAPLALMSAATAAVTYAGQRRAGAMTLLAHTSTLDRMKHAIAAYAIYVGQVCWPSRLAVLYPYRPAVSATTIVIGIAILVGMSALAARFIARAPYLMTGWTWFAVALVPTIGLVPVGAQAHADRFTYIPAVGLFIIAAWSADRWRAHTRSATVAAAGLVLAALVAASAQAGYWKDSTTLMQRTVDVTGDNAIARHLLGVSLAAEERLDEAVVNYRESLRLAPRNPLALENLGIALMGLGRPADAAAAFAEAAHQRPDYGEAHYGLGAALLDLGRRPEARAELETSRRLSMPQAYAAQVAFRLGLIAAYDGDLSRARDEFAAALRLQPDFPEARANLAEATSRLAR